MMLQDPVCRAAETSPGRIAVRCNGVHTVYGDLHATSNRVARALQELGVTPSTRVGMWMEKSERGIAVMQGAMRVGAAYVPIDPASPPTRVATILRDCGIDVLATTAERGNALAADMPGLRTLTVDTKRASHMAWTDLSAYSNADLPRTEATPESLAYILYTSGSTGVPKGVCISHRAALAFVNWAHEELKSTPDDRFASHAPFHFDLSVLDLYCAFSAAASVSIIPESSAYNAQLLTKFIKSEMPTIWYSVPSAISLMMEHGGLLDLSPVPIRALLFAGEPFPIRRLRELRLGWPDLRLLNLYGPTETNVCTFFEVHASDVATDVGIPIGKGCCGDRVWAVTDEGSEAAPGETGELLVTGPTLMHGYWGKPGVGTEPYRTGDIVRQRSDGNYEYVGRRDHMVKIRGHRVELEEIEVALQAHADVRHGAVAVAGTGLDGRLVAFLVAEGERKPPLLELKQHCASRLPRYMIIDRVVWLDGLPRTANGKVDRHALKARLADGDK